MVIDSTFWVAVSFVLFFGGLIYLKVGKVIGLEYMALRDIEPGEEILVDYFNSGENVEFINEDLETPMEDFSISPDLIEQTITRTIG